jgi:hypothetical protein
MKKQTEQVVEQQVEQVEVAAVATPAELIAKHGNKSKAIRALNAAGSTRGEIAKMLKIRYQHVRNVLITPVKSA